MPDNGDKYSIIRLNQRRNGFAVVNGGGAIHKLDGKLAFKLTASKAMQLLVELNSATTGSAVDSSSVQIASES